MCGLSGPRNISHRPNSVASCQFVSILKMYAVISSETCYLGGLRLGSAAARLLGKWVRILPGALMSVSCEYCVLSGRVLCDGPITGLEESYRECCVCKCTL